MNCKIRKMKEEEYYLLDDFLYEAIFIPKGVTPPPKSVINIPELQVYTKNFGTYKNDIAFIAEIDKKIIGAAWVRIMKDYGHIDDATPSLAMSLYKEYRSKGIGTSLLEELLLYLKSKGYKKVSLSVQKENYAVNLYKKIGFIIIDNNQEEYIMVKYL